MNNFDLNAISEAVDLECKLAHGKDGQGEIPKDFWPTYSAMANTRGGQILLGLSEKNGTFQARGLTNPNKLRTDLFNTLNNPSKVNINLLTDEHICEKLLDGKTILVINVPAANRNYSWNICGAFN